MRSASEPGRERIRDLGLAPDPAQIASCAHLIWLQEGCPEGCAVRHWLEAEEQLWLTAIQDAAVGPNADSRRGRSS
jgi:hypothetical protein